MAKGWTPASVQGVDEEQSFPKSEEEQTERLGRCLWHYQRSLERFLELPSQHTLRWASFSLNVVSRLQSGPTCGLVAMRMAAETLSQSQRENESSTRGSDSGPSKEHPVTGQNPVEEEVGPGRKQLEAAKAAGVTLKGEMFSAIEYAAFANQYFGPNGVQTSLQPLSASYHPFPRSGRTFARLLLTAKEERLDEGTDVATSLLAVPYDASANHEPCLKNGIRAHWGLAKGLAIPFFLDSPIGKAIEENGNFNKHTTPSDVIVYLSPDAVTMANILETAWQETESMGNTVEDMGKDWMTTRQEQGTKRAGECVNQGICSTSSLFVIVQQSKSKHQAVYPFEMIMASNANLHDIETDRREDFHMPNDMNDLRNNLVLLKSLTSD